MIFPLIALIGLWVIPYYDARTDKQWRLWVWLVALGLLAIFLVVVGHGMTGLWRGVLVDNRNKISLSRLQMALWTLLIVSGFLAAALTNVSLGCNQPLNITVPEQLWLLLGISTTSLVGSALILDSKKSVPVQAGQQELVDRTKDKLSSQGIPADKVAHEGQVMVYCNPGDSRWSDLFRGEEIGNASYLDLSKVQMFYFTLIVVLSYGVSLGALFVSALTARHIPSGGIHNFPDITGGAAALLAISHAGYLTSKAIPHSSAPGTA